MQMPQVITSPQRRITAYDTDPVFFPLTDWVPAQDVDNIRVLLRVLTELGDATLYFAFQTAEVVTDVAGSSYLNAGPNGWLPAGTAITDDGLHLENLSIGTSIGSNFLVRFGVAVQSATAGDRVQASVGLEVQINNGPIALGAAENLDLSMPKSSIGFTQHLAVTPWLPAYRLEEIHAAYMHLELTGNSTIKVVYQTAVDREFPSVLTDTGIQSTSEGAAVASQSTTSYTGAAMWIRFGISYIANTDAQAEANVNIAFSGRYGA